jgi:hypothetical protein
MFHGADHFLCRRLRRPTFEWLHNSMTKHVQNVINLSHGSESPPLRQQAPAGGNGLIQKKKKRDKYRAAEQDRPVPYIKTKISTCATNAPGSFLG